MYRSGEEGEFEVSGDGMNMYKLRGGEDNVVQLHDRRIRIGDSDEEWLSPHLGGRSDATQTLDPFLWRWELSDMAWKFYLDMAMQLQLHVAKLL